jgi:protein TonB
MNQALIRHRRSIIFTAAGLLHLAAFIFIRFSMPPAGEVDESKYEILKLVDVEEYLPPPPKENVTTVYNQPTASEQVIQSESAVYEVDDSQYGGEPDYLPQHKVSSIPVMPTSDILSRIEYPPIALRQGIEGVVYLELFIDQSGIIRKVKVLKDPGYGFAEAAVAVLQNVLCKPAMANGVPVAVRFRYPVRFSLQ